VEREGGPESLRVKRVKRVKRSQNRMGECRKKASLEVPHCRGCD
jgi:hypothetical protein